MYEHLDAMENLKVRKHRHGADAGRRCLNGGCNDAVTDLLGQCQSPSQLAQIAGRFGLSAEEITCKAQRAVGFGQFRMAIGNRIRGIVRRIDRARRQGRPITVERAARPSRRPRQRPAKSAGQPLAGIRHETTDSGASFKRNEAELV